MIPAAGGGGPITYVGGASGEADGVTSNTVTLPSYSSDDFAVAFLSGNFTASETFSEITAGGWTKQHETDNADINAAVFTKVLGASETNPEFSVTTAGIWVATIAIFAGVDTTTPLDGTITSVIHTDYDYQLPAITVSESTSAFVGLAYVKGSKPTSLSNASTSPGALTAVLQGFDSHRNRGVFYDLDIGSTGSIQYDQNCVWSPQSGPAREAAYISVALKMA